MFSLSELRTRSRCWTTSEDTTECLVLEVQTTEQADDNNQMELTPHHWTFHNLGLIMEGLFGIPS